MTANHLHIFLALLFLSSLVSISYIFQWQQKFTFGDAEVQFAFEVGPGVRMGNQADRQVDHFSPRQGKPRGQQSSGKAVPAANASISEVADYVYSLLTLEQRVGQLTMIALPGCILNATAKRFLERTLPGGLMLCPYHVNQSAEASVVRGFLAAAQRHHMGYRSPDFKLPNLPLFIGLDQEGGRPGRDPMTPKQGVTAFPSPMAAGISGNETLIYNWGLVTGAQLRALGVSMNLAPVLDVNNNPRNPIIHLRAFGDNPETVARLGAAYVRGQEAAGCLTVVKHFPGHGDTTADSHKGAPQMPFDRARLDAVEFPSFKAGIAAGAGGVMTAHIAFPKLLGSGTPATLSPYFLQNVLRHEMGFEGLIITDDIKMKGLGMNVWNATIASISAGADMVLTSGTEDMYGTICDMVDSLRHAVRSGLLGEERLKQSVTRVLRYKLQYGVMRRKGDRITLGSPLVLPPQHRAILKTADELNRQLSRGGLLWHGPLHLLSFNATASRRIFIIHRKEFRDAVQLRSQDIALVNIAQGLKLKLKPRLSTIIYLYMPNTDTMKAQEGRRLASSLNASFVILAAGNPFRFARYSCDGILFSFSTTFESVMAMAAVMNGQLLPPTNADNVHLFSA